MTKAACPHLIPWPDGKACRICFDDREAEVERLRESNFAAETEAIRVVMDDATVLRAEVERLREALVSIQKLVDEGASLSLIFWRADAALRGGGE